MPLPLPLQRLVALCACALWSAVALAQPAAPPTPPAGLVAELEQLSRLDLLPRYRPGTRVAQVSSYDRTGGNDDGFSGRYSSLRSEGGKLVLLDVRGPGVVHRIWTPTPTDDTLEFYFDGEREARLRVRFSDLFSGGVFPFVRPVVGNEVGGFYSYVPVPFARSLKVLFAGRKIMFHQFQYRLYDPARAGAVASYPRAWGDAERRALARAQAAWAGYRGAPPDSVVDPAGVGRTESTAVDLGPGDTVEFFRAARGGRVTALTFSPAAAFAGPGRDVVLEARWDGDARPAVRAPLADFFGYAYGAPAMQGLLAGVRGGEAYSYLPMPFDRAASLRLVYLRRPGAAQPRVRATARVRVAPRPRDPAAEGRLYASWRREPDVPLGRPFGLLDARGRGHHVGTVLLARGRDPGMTLFFEGDDRAEVDGRLALHGTGSEDYFNGGWYALLDRWDRGFSLPLHGALAYSLPMARTGGYRFSLADKVSFDSAYRLTIEHGGEGNAAPGDYAAVAFYYGDAPPLGATAPTPALTAAAEPTTHVFYPQLMRLSVGWHSAVRILEDRQALELAPSGAAGAPNDALVRVELDEVPPGRYRLLLTHVRAPSGGEFSVWQRQRPVAPWRSAYAPADTVAEREPAGEVEVSDQVRTVSLRVRGPAGRNAFRLRQLVLERLPD